MNECVCGACVCVSVSVCRAIAAAEVDTWVAGIEGKTATQRSGNQDIGSWES